MLASRRLAVVVAGLAGAAALSAAPAAASPYTQHLNRGATTSVQGGVMGKAQITKLEIAPFRFQGDGGQSKGARRVPINPSLARRIGLRGRAAAARALAVRGRGDDRVTASWQALNHFQQRFAGNGNQFSLVPPDQGLCVGAGYVLETVNDVMRVYRTNGRPVTAPTTANAFFGYPPAINRTTGKFGPLPGDPSCYFDPQSQRWFNLTWTFETDPDTGNLTGYQHLDLAVSRSSSPLRAWRIYRLPSQNNGQQGTPNHGCSGGFCLSDYPHLGADRYGFYITTNEYGIKNEEFHGAQLYAIAKAALVRGAARPRVLLYQNLRLAGQPGFTVWPAISTDGRSAATAGGTEFFLSSNAAPEANGNGASNQLGVWALTGTRTLGNRKPTARLLQHLLAVPRYAIPPKAVQKPGPAPLAACLNNTTLPTPFGPGCWQLLLTPDEKPTTHSSLQALDTNDTRMQQTVYVNGRIWGALDTAVTIGGKRRAGIAWYAVTPWVRNGRLGARLSRTGSFGVRGSDIGYPAVGPLRNGEAAIAVTLYGPRYYPSAAWIHIGRHGAGPLNVIAKGVGPYDSFEEYAPFVGTPVRPRWGDYGAAVPMGNGVWVASEYIAQRCTLKQWLVDTAASPLGTCGMTRSALSNWSTRISRVLP